jgi:hypothetical protein
MLSQSKKACRMLEREEREKMIKRRTKLMKTMMRVMD